MFLQICAKFVADPELGERGGRQRCSHGLDAIKKGKRKDQGVPQSQDAVFSRHQEEEGTDKTKQAQIEQTLTQTR